MTGLLHFVGSDVVLEKFKVSFPFLFFFVVFDIQQFVDTRSDSFFIVPSVWSIQFTDTEPHLLHCHHIDVVDLYQGPGVAQGINVQLSLPKIRQFFSQLWFWNIIEFVIPNVFRSQGSSDVENPGNNLYVTGLSSRITKGELEKHFGTEGKVWKAIIYLKYNIVCIVC